MTMFYRTDGPWGAGQGYNGTASQIDYNFWQVVGRLQAIEDNPPVAVPPSNMTLVGSQWTIYYPDGLTFGPFTVPQANFRPAITEEVSTDTYELLITDGNKYKRFTHVDGCAVHITAGLAMVVDSEIYMRQVGAGSVTIDGDTDVTINIPDGLLAQSAIRHGSVVLKCVGVDEYDLEGRLAEDVTA